MTEAIIIEILSSLQFKGGLDKESVRHAMKNGAKSVKFTEIISWLGSELQFFNQLESQVNPISGTDDEDVDGFQVELSSMLKELGCPYEPFVSGCITKRFPTEKDRALLIIYLCSEIQAARMCYERKTKTEKPMIVELSETPTAHDLKEALVSLGFGKPPDNITSQILFKELEKKLRNICSPMEPVDFAGKRLLALSLSEKDWFQVEKLQSDMETEYSTRREMLISRLDVTVNSFQWSDRLKVKSDEISKIYDVHKKKLLILPEVHMSDILAAGQELLYIEKTCAASVRENTQSAINKVLIGAVPDRGGRPDEQRPPPPEIPSWQKNDPKGQQSFGSGGDGSQRGNARGGSSYGGDSGGYGSQRGNARGGSSYGGDSGGYGSSRGNARGGSSYGGDSGGYGSQRGNARGRSSYGGDSGFHQSYRSSHGYQRGRGHGNDMGVTAVSSAFCDDKRGASASNRPPCEDKPFVSSLNPAAPAFNPNRYPQSEISYVVPDNRVGFGGYVPMQGGNFQQFGNAGFTDYTAAPRGHMGFIGERGARRGGGSRGHGHRGYGPYY